MHLNYTLSFEGWKAALRLHRRKKFFRRFGALIWPMFTVVFWSLALISNAQTSAYAVCFALGAGFLVVSITYPIMRIYVDRRGYRRIFSPTRKDRSCYIDMDDNQILSGLPEVSEEKYFWKAIVGVAQDDKMTLLYLDRDKFLLFPTTMLSPAQRTEFNDLVARHVMKG